MRGSADVRPLLGRRCRCCQRWWVVRRSALEHRGPARRIAVKDGWINVAASIGERPKRVRRTCAIAHSSSPRNLEQPVTGGPFRTLKETDAPAPRVPTSRRFTGPPSAGASTPHRAASRSTAGGSRRRSGLRTGRRGTLRGPDQRPPGSAAMNCDRADECARALPCRKLFDLSFHVCRDLRRL